MTVARNATRHAREGFALAGSQTKFQGVGVKGHRLTDEALEPTDAARRILSRAGEDTLEFQLGPVLVGLTPTHHDCQRCWSIGTVGDDKSSPNCLPPKMPV